MLSGQQGPVSSTRQQDVTHQASMVDCTQLLFEFRGSSSMWHPQSHDLTGILDLSCHGGRMLTTTGLAVSQAQPASFVS